MKKIFYLILSLLLVTVVTISSNSCGGSRNDTTIDPTETIIDPIVEEVSVNRPTLVKVYIDASGSMADYFGSKDIDIDTISAAITSLASVSDSSKVEYYVWGNSKPISRDQLTKKFLTKDLKGKSSYFHDIFKPMEEISHKDTLAVLITDGIMSSASAQTKLSGKYTDYNKINLAIDIKTVLEGKGKSISIYRMIGNFNGRYWNKANNAVPYKGKRPFFVIVMGDAENVRYFDDAARKGNIHDVYTNAEALHIGTAPMRMEVRVHPLDAGNDNIANAEDLVRREGTDTYDYTGEIGFRLGDVLPKWLLDNYDSRTIKEMSEVLIDGKETSIKPDVDNGSIVFTIPESEVKKKADLGNKYTITYRMKDPSAGAWDAYSVEDDTLPDDRSTYLLKDFIDAIRKGILGNETNLLESTIEIDPTGQE